MLQQKGIVPPKRTWYPKIQWFVLIFPMNMFEIWGSLGIPHSYPFLNKPRDQSSYQVRGTYLSNVLRVQSGKGLSRDRQGMSVEKVHPQVPQHVQTWRRIDHTCAKMKVTLACPISLVAGLDRDKPYGTNLVPKQRRYSATLVAGCIMLVIWEHPYLSEIMALSAQKIVRFSRWIGICFPYVLNYSIGLPNKRTRNHCPPSCRKNTIIT